jgi:hypothetical protein
VHVVKHEQAWLGQPRETLAKPAPRKAGDIPEVLRHQEGQVGSTLAR